MRRYEYKTHMVPPRGNPDESIAKEGWIIVYHDESDDGTFMVWRRNRGVREAVEET